MCEIMQEIRMEGRMEGRIEGRSEGEERMGRLVDRLVSGGHSDDVARVAVDKEYRREMYKKYNID